jgi:opacity protein-like surface antigen
LDEVRSGFIYGGGIEAPITQNWTGRFEVMYVNFGSQNSTITGLPAFGPGFGTFTTSFHNSLTLGRLALSYRW